MIDIAGLRVFLVGCGSCKWSKNCEVVASMECNLAQLLVVVVEDAGYRHLSLVAAVVMSGGQSIICIAGLRDFLVG